MAESKLVTVKDSKYIYFLRSEGTTQIVMDHPSDFSLKVSAEAAIITNKGD